MSLLSFSRNELEDYVQQENLSWVEDERPKYKQNGGSDTIYLLHCKHDFSGDVGFSSGVADVTSLQDKGDSSLKADEYGSLLEDDMKDDGLKTSSFGFSGAAGPDVFGAEPSRPPSSWRAAMVGNSDAAVTPLDPELENIVSDKRKKTSGAFALAQRLGRSLMLPIATLPAAGLLLRLAQ